MRFRFHCFVGSLAAVLFAACVAAPAAAGGSDPEVVLDEIFGQVDAMCGGDGQGQAYDLNAIAAAYFSPDLVEIVGRDYEAPNALGFDILVDAQDCKIDGLDLNVVDRTDETAVGRATFTNFGEARIVDLHMAKSGSAWRVSDVVYGHRTFSLKGEK